MTSISTSAKQNDVNAFDRPGGFSNAVCSLMSRVGAVFQLQRKKNDVNAFDRPGGFSNAVCSLMSRVRAVAGQTFKIEIVRQAISLF